MRGTLGERLKALRKNKGLSQTELATVLSMANSTLSQYENARRTPGDDVKIRIAEYFDTTVDYLVGRAPSSLRDQYGLTGSVDEMVEQMYKNPKLKILFDRSAELTEEGVDAVLQIVEMMTKERDDFSSVRRTDELEKELP